MNTEKLTLPHTKTQDDSTKIAEILIRVRQIHELAATVATSDERLSERFYQIRYEAENALNAARALSEPALVS